jgi:septal ring factor EnvC (AmiA/AmiB activator)
VVQCQKEKNYQLELMRLKGEEDANRLRRDFESRLDELHRELKAKDYHVRDLTEKNAYLDSKAAELRKGVDELEGEQLRARETAATLQDRLAQEEFRKKKLQVVREEL